MPVQKEAIIKGIAPDKVLVVAIKNERGSYHESRIPVGAGIIDKLNDALRDWLGKTVRMTVERGKIKAIEPV